MKKIFATILMMVATMTAWAVPTITINTDKNGTVTSSVSGTTVTLTATPAEGFYITADDFAVTLTINGQQAQARNRVPGLQENPTVTATDATANPSGVTTYTFTLPSEEYDATVTAVFQARTSIEKATVTLTPTSFEYTGEAKVPTTVTVALGQTTLVANTDYTVAYADNINVGNATATVTGQGIYTGSATANYSITAKAATISFATDAVTKTYGDAAFTNALTNTGNGSVFFSSSNTSVATVDNSTGEVTITGAGETTIMATVAIAEGANYSYENNTASYMLSVAKATGSIRYATKTVTKEYNAENFTNELTKTGDGTVTYSSSNAEVASVNESTGEVTVGKPGEATITATVEDGANYTYEWKKATYKITVNHIPTTMAFSVDAVTLTAGDNFQTPTLTTNPTGLTVTYSSSKEDVATVDKNGTVSLTGATGSTSITASYAGDDLYAPASAFYVITVNTPEVKKYDLWVGGVQVTEDNMNDILGDQTEDHAASFVFNGENTIVLTDVNMNKNIESRLPGGLSIYLIGDNSIDISSTDVAAIRQTGTEGTLTVKTDGNYPGKLSLIVSEGSTRSVIEGFSDISLEQTLTILAPEDAVYSDLKMTKDGSNVKSLTIGTPIKPLVEETTVEFANNDFTQKDEDTGEVTETSLYNTVIDDILYTSIDPSKDEGFDDTEQCIVLNTPIEDEKVEEVAATQTPGTTAYADEFPGLTLLLPAGSGKLVLDLLTEDGIELGVKIGEEAPRILSSLERKLKELGYDVPRPTFVQIYLRFLGTSNEARRAVKPFRAKKTTTHVKIYSVTIQPTKVESSTPVKSVADNYPTQFIPSQGQEVIPVIPVGIDVQTAIRVLGNESWYNMNGQKVSQPNQKGVYIMDGRKVVIK